MARTEHDLVIVGGGPAGCTAAAIAARAGLRVLLLEADRHPRVHVGESLLPGIIPILEAMGALADVENAGFTRKTGSTHWGWGATPEWDLWFTDSEAYDHAWIVDRSRFDQILFQAAQRAGADAREHHAVKSFLREGDRVVGVAYRVRGSDETHEARAPFTIDASGQAAVLARELGSRRQLPGLQHEASWAHYEGGGRLPPPRDAQALFSASQGKWIWQFPLAGGRTSVGIIRLEDDPTISEKMREEQFDAAVRADLPIAEVLGPGARRVTPVRNVRDWSYRVDRVSGPGWFTVGDASGFIDPVLSTGVLLAMHAAWDATQQILAARDGRRTEEEARRAYDAHHAELFENLMGMVRFFYRQNVARDDYFWKAKELLVGEASDFKPRKAFTALTSGLIANNLAYRDKRDRIEGARAERAERGADASDVSGVDPDRLGFVCIHLRWRDPASDAQAASPLYLLVEPADRTAPTLFRTRNLDVNCLAPRHGHDPILVPGIAPHLQGIAERIRALDAVEDDDLASFWRRTRDSLMGTVHALPPEFELVRVFGQ